MPNQWQIRAVALDVDGTLTDGTVTWSDQGDEIKRFHFLDIMGIARAQRLGIRFALISGENSVLVTRFAEKLGIQDIWLGCTSKGAAFEDFATRCLLDKSAVAFMGDDVNDLPALRLAGLAAAPPTAHPAVLEIAQFISDRPAGAGAVRRLIDHLWGEKINI